MSIVSKTRILGEYERIFNQHKNDAIRFAEVAKKFGIEVNQVVETVHEAQNQMENT